MVEGVLGQWQSRMSRSYMAWNVFLEKTLDAIVKDVDFATYPAYEHMSLRLILS